MSMIISTFRTEITSNFFDNILTFPDGFFKRRT